jgi:hypothetical protein
VLLLALYLSAAFGVSWALYRDFSRQERAPHFAIYVNDLPVGDKGTNYLTFPFPTNEASAQFIVTAFNDGTWPAENLRLLLKFPPPPNFRIKSADGWHRGATPIHGENKTKIDPLAPVYSVESTASSINVRDEFAAPPMVFEWVGGLNFVQIGVSAKNMPRVFKLVALHYKEGVDKPHLGF